MVVIRGLMIFMEKLEMNKIFLKMWKVILLKFYYLLVFNIGICIFIFGLINVKLVFNVEMN